MSELLNINWTKYIPHVPTPKQIAYLSLPHEEAFYGGAAGGGKSDALLMGALQHVDIPGYSAILFRRSLTDHKLANSILSRAKTWLSPYLATKEVKWLPGEHSFLFPSGATVGFGYLASEGTELRYQSAEYQYIGFDEVTHFFEDEYLYLFSRLRRLQESPVPLRMRSASNPGGRGHAWVKRRFAIKADENGQFVGHNPRAPYIPAKVADNPYLDQESYLDNLDKMGRVARDRLKLGDWSVVEDTIYSPYWFTERYKVQTWNYSLPTPNGQKRIHKNNLLVFTTVDCASSVKTGVGGAVFYKGKQTSYSVIATWGLTKDYELLLLDVQRAKCDIPTLVDMIFNNQKIWKPAFNRIESNGPGQGVYQMCERRGLPVRPIQTTNDKIIMSTAAQLRAEAGKIYLPAFAPWLTDFEEEVFYWTGHPDETDDQVDVLSSAANEAAERAVGMEYDPFIDRGSYACSPQTGSVITSRHSASARYAGLECG